MRLLYGRLGFEFQRNASRSAPQKNTSFIDEKGTIAKVTQLQLDEPMEYLGAISQINDIQEVQIK